MKKILFFTLFITITFAYTLSFAEYKIILKNGRDFIVENYKDMGGSIKFYRSGGEIEIDKGNIETIKKMKTVAKETEPSGAEEADFEKPDVKSNNDAQTRVEIENRARELVKKIEEMKAEGAKLTEEKKRLEEEFKKEGRLMSTRKRREFEQRSSVIEKKIIKFNEEIKKLNREQNEVLKEMETLPKK